MAYTGIVGTVLMRMHDAGTAAMGPQAISGRFETLWQSDGPNAQPDVSERFKTGFWRFLGRFHKHWHPSMHYAVKKRAPDRWSSWMMDGGLFLYFISFLKF